MASGYSNDVKRVVIKHYELSPAMVRDIFESEAQELIARDGMVAKALRTRRLVEEHNLDFTPLGQQVRSVLRL